MVIQTQQKQKGTFFSIWWVIIIFFAILYFCYHLYHGELGLKSRKQLRIQISKEEQILKELKEEQAFWEHRVKLLGDGTLEPDILDEYIRRNNSLSGNNELIVIIDNDNDSESS